jgi:hypothetical protein
VAIFIGNEAIKLSTSDPFDAVAGVGGTILSLPSGNYSWKNPAVKTVMTFIELRCTSATAITDEATVNIAIPGFSGFLPYLSRGQISQQKLTGLVMVDDKWTIRIDGGSVVLPHAFGRPGNVTLSFVSPATGTSQIIIADVFGYRA